MNNLAQKCDGGQLDDCLSQVLGCPVESLPTLPVVALELLKLATDEGSSAADLVKVIGRDPVLTARLLKIANSPIFGLSGNVASLSRAVVLLGLEEIRNLALGLLVFDTADGAGGKRKSYHRGQIWTHCLMVGLLAEILAQEEFGLGPGFYVYGLIHDIGKVVLDA
ncbi:MAG: HDOD domain-containing protein, partial [Deltaproteobacteria bacterium]|nr:HDOD domain-containing protein [Deltaproteobacteria bacterium]